MLETQREDEHQHRREDNREGKRTAISKRECKTMVDSDRLGQVRMKTEQHIDRSEKVIQQRRDIIEEKKTEKEKRMAFSKRDCK